jgi:hypothetical protein
MPSGRILRGLSLLYASATHKPKILNRVYVRRNRYAVEFPRMIRGWRAAFESPKLPFFYVELCTQYDMPGFWAAQRAALSLGNVGFATTTDIQVSLVELLHHNVLFISRVRPALSTSR